MDRLHSVSSSPFRTSSIKTAIRSLQADENGLDLYRRSLPQEVAVVAKLSGRLSQELVLETAGTCDTPEGVTLQVTPRSHSTPLYLTEAYTKGQRYQMVETHLKIQAAQAMARRTSDGGSIKARHGHPLPPSGPQAAAMQLPMQLPKPPPGKLTLR